MSYFHWKYNQLSSALRRFTVLFGMGSSEWEGVGPPRYGRPAKLVVSCRQLART